ncbi:MAG: AAA family ATPase [Candidatus Omnitrophica bacterium]|nr:AAA family ATPase [Candidatus Omnitrophota bacterium]
MIRSFYGIDDHPFSMENITLLAHQLEVYDTLRVHCQQGGLCMILGSPGTGKTVIKESLKQIIDKRIVVATVARTLHTYTNTIKVLCQSFNIEFDGSHFKCEKRLIEEAFSLNRQGKMLITIIDDAHLMEMNTLRKLRLLFEDFPKNHNVILIGQPVLLSNLSLTVNADIKSRISYSTIMRKLNPDDIEKFILSQLDRVKLGHNIFTEDALDLIVRSSDGILRKARNLCIACMLEAVRLRDKSIGLDNVNRVLIQPHWRKDYDLDHF